MNSMTSLLQGAAYAASLALIMSIPGLFLPLGDSVLGSVNRLTGGGVVVLWLVSVAAAGRLSRLSLFHLAAFAFALWYMASWWWSVAPDETPFTANLVEGVAVSALIWDIYRTQARIEAAMQAFLFGGYLSIVTMVLNFASGQQARQWEKRFAATGFDPNDIALLLAIGVPMATYLVTRKSGPIFFRVLNFLYPIGAALAIVLSGSRGALLAALPAYLFYFVRMARLGPAWRVAVVLVLAGVAFGATQLDIGAPLQRLATVTGSSGDDHLDGRSEIWQAAWRAFGEHPYLGVGGGAFQAATLGRNGQEVALVAHNTYLSVLSELGPVGFLLFAVILTLVIRSALGQAAPMREMSLTALVVWAIGVSALSWEFRSQTWFLFGLIVAASPAVPPVPVQPIFRILMPAAEEIRP